MDDAGQRRTHALAGLAAGALLLGLLAASLLVARWAGARIDLEEGRRLVRSAEPERRLLGLAKLGGDPRAASVYARLLDDPDPRVRLTAALMLAGVAGIETPGAADEAADEEALVERMRAWWRLEGRARHGSAQPPE